MRDRALTLTIVIPTAIFLWVWAGNNEKTRARLDRLEAAAGITKPCEIFSYFPNAEFRCPK